MADKKKNEGMVNTVPPDNRKLSGARPVRTEDVHPAYAEDQDVVRTNVLLKNGTTVAIDDYDEEVHGPKVEEDDEQYRQRMAQKAHNRPGMRRTAPVTIGNLQSFDANVDNPTATPATVPPPNPVGTPATGSTVVTADDLSGDKDKRTEGHDKGSNAKGKEK